MVTVISRIVFPYIYTSSDSEMANKRRKVNTLSCACNWPECQSFSSLFNRYEDRDYAGNHIELRCGIESLMKVAIENKGEHYSEFSSHLDSGVYNSDESLLNVNGDVLTVIVQIQ